MESLVQSFKGLGDPTRLRILRLLAQAPLNVSELVSLVGVAQPSVSHHLGKLRGMGFIREERQAGFSYYSLSVPDSDPRWPLIRMAQAADDPEGDLARLSDLVRAREDRQALNEKLLEPGQSWSLWATALSSLLPPLEVADFGCGTGALTVAMARWAKKVVAIDQSGAALNKARERAEKEGLSNIRFLREDLHALSLPDAKKDLVVLSQSLHHVEEPKQVLQEAARVLKPNGRIVVLELLPHDEQWVRERLGHRHLGFSPDTLEVELAKAHFTKLSLELPPRDGKTPFRVFLLTGVRR